MRILIHMTLWKRHEIAPLIVKGLNALRAEAHKHGHEVEVLYIYSELDTLHRYANGLHSRYFKKEFCDNLPLGKKNNIGLAYALDVLKFDYMMQIGSDDVISIEYWAAAKRYMQEGFDIIGCKKLRVVNHYTGDELIHQAADILGAGRMIKYDTLIKASRCLRVKSKVNSTKTRKGMEYTIALHQYKPAIHQKIGEVTELWDNDRNSGLDYNSECNVHNRCGRIKMAVIDKDYDYLVTDIKTNDNIHKFEKFKK